MRLASAFPPCSSPSPTCSTRCASPTRSEDVTFEERFEQIRQAPLLVLDDFGTQSATEWAREKLFQILNYRYINRLPTRRSPPTWRWRKSRAASARA